MEIQMNEVPPGPTSKEAIERMRTTVQVTVNVTDRHPDDTHYVRTSYRLYVDRDVWYGASDKDRAAALTAAANDVARRTAERSC